MSTRDERAVCRTADEAWEAGYTAPCEHGVPDPTACADCRLTPEEIGHFAVLLSGLYSDAPGIDRSQAA
ncbi:hypothetical protein [Streptomyces sp. DH37]|uniref:hypothetical protein n=1 Tax=Streptomyces sp. DH37 TaxID=3040122 RepID=UPI002442DC48|nr:hypothetical protein [Streptomyces sp. DH37]MDG9703732.1 hypothetical protein [Streptomyces sp. DH37]